MNMTTEHDDDKTANNFPKVGSEEYNRLRADPRQQKLRYARAMALAKQHPDWTHRQLEDVVKSEFGVGLSSPTLSKLMAKARGLSFRPGSGRKNTYAKGLRKQTTHEQADLPFNPPPRQSPVDVEPVSDADVRAAIAMVLEVIPDLTRLDVLPDGEVSIERRSSNRIKL